MIRIKNKTLHKKVLDLTNKYDKLELEALNIKKAPRFLVTKEQAMIIEEVMLWVGWKAMQKKKDMHKAKLD